MGLDKLTICVDHKPLLGIINDVEFEKIDNSRLFRLKEKTLGWRFKVIHLPAKQYKEQMLFLEHRLLQTQLCYSIS